MLVTPRRRRVVGRLLGRAQDERGGVLVLVALSIPVVLLLTAFVFDTGNWYTHKRQLQNRADAGAFAAGNEYQTRWSQCVQTADVAVKNAAAAAIINAARKYAGDPSATGPVNTEIANQSKLVTILNSPSFNAGTDYTDGAPGDLASPCYNHPPDSISPTGGHWTDVKVHERDLPSLFGRVGLDLPSNGAQARIQIHPKLSLQGLLPLAVPNQVIVQAQLRYYNECTYNSNNPGASELARVNLNPLDDPYQTMAGSGDTLWGARGGAQPGDKVNPSTIPLPLPTMSGCGQRYVPIGVEVRLASIPSTSLNIDTRSCSQLQSDQFADCFHRLSTIRVWPTTNPNNGNAPLVKNVVATSSNCPTPLPTGDPYFGRGAGGASTCAAAISVDIDWGDRDNGPLNVIGNFDVEINGIPVTSKPSQPTGVWSVPSATLGAGANDIDVRLVWADTNTTHTWNGSSCGSGNQNPCRYNQTFDVHRAFVGDNTSAGIVDLVRTSLDVQLPGPGNYPRNPLDNVDLAASGSQLLVYPTLALRNPLVTGVQTTLRDGDPQANQSLDCDPDMGSGSSGIRRLFAEGCTLWYGKNPFTQGLWWNEPSLSCPAKSQWFSTSLPSSSPYVNRSANPWRCVPTLPGGRSALLDGIAIRTGNCPGYNQSSYSCSNPTCVNPNYYDPSAKASLYPGPGIDKRIVTLYVVPYQALKGAGGNNQSQIIPILGFANFYVAGWKASGNNADPCTSDPDGSGPARPDVIPADDGAMTGYFIEHVSNDPGQVDTTITCTVGQLTPCQAVLVR